MWRAHQAQAIELWGDVERHLRPVPTDIFAHIACGGGKQGLAGLMAYYAVERLKLVDKFLWVTPRAALCRQGADSLLPDDWLARQLPHHLQCLISVNNLNPSKDKSGYTTTYQALAADGGGINRAELERYRYALILDEFHHLARGGQYARAVAPLVERARLRIWMTGTLDRSDRVPIVGMPYLDSGYPDTSDTPERVWLQYRIADATRDRAIILPHFRLVNARAEWRENGQDWQAEELGRSRGAIYTALRTEYAEALLEQAVRHWQVYRATNPRSKLLVVCADKRQARKTLAILKRLSPARVDLAVSSESADEYREARHALHRFRGQRLHPGDEELDALVTVAMAYEGLDVPSITHLVCLTHIRSRPWIAQMFARAWRYDAASPIAYEQQLAHIWVPDDLIMREMIAEIEEEFAAAAYLGRTKPPRTGGGDDDDDDEQEPAITPGRSMATLTTAYALNGAALASELTMRYLEVAERAGLPLSPLQVHRLVEELERVDAPQAVGAANGHAAGSWPARTPQQELEYWRRHLDDVVGQRAASLMVPGYLNLGEAKTQINVALKQRFGERDALPASVLEKAVQWVLVTYAG